jgi:hypothetical protein
MLKYRVAVCFRKNLLQFPNLCEKQKFRFDLNKKANFKYLLACKIAQISAFYEQLIRKISIKNVVIFVHYANNLSISQKICLPKHYNKQRN